VDFFLVAMPYTLADQAALHGPMAECLRRGIKVVIGAPFASGLLANPSAPGVMYAYQPAGAEMVAKAKAIEAVCARYNVPLGRRHAVSFTASGCGVRDSRCGERRAGNAERGKRGGANPGRALA
jgi:aryl-alcohol dehydrogenase-like predicted oxidoreductase